MFCIILSNRVSSVLISLEVREFANILDHSFSIEKIVDIFSFPFSSRYSLWTLLSSQSNVLLIYPAISSFLINFAMAPLWKCKIWASSFWLNPSWRYIATKTGTLQSKSFSFFNLDSKKALEWRCIIEKFLNRLYPIWVFSLISKHLHLLLID